MHDHDSDTDDLDFAMLTQPTRPGPCKAANAPEVDPVEKRLEREREAAEHIAAAAEAPGCGWRARCGAERREPAPLRQLEISKALAADVCCPDCGHETGYPGRCMSCDWHASQSVEVQRGSGKVKV